MLTLILSAVGGIWDNCWASGHFLGDYHSLERPIGLFLTGRFTIVSYRFRPQTDGSHFIVQLSFLNWAVQRSNWLERCSKPFDSFFWAETSIHPGLSLFSSSSVLGVSTHIEGQAYCSLLKHEY